MDCRTCEPTLIDLVYSELATDAAREAHAHLAQCTSCRTSFERLVSAKRLAADLPLLEPPAGIEDRVLQMAEEHARATIARKSVAAPKPSAWRRLLDLIGVLVSRPQFAMSAVMVLMVAVGLISLPRLRHEPAATGTTVIDPDPEGEAAPSTGVAPAEPLDLKVDLRARRIRSKDEVELPAAQPAMEPAAPAVAASELARRDQQKADDPFAALDDELGLAKNEAQAAAGPAKKSALEAPAEESKAYAEARGKAKRAMAPADSYAGLAEGDSPEAFPGSLGSGAGKGRDVGALSGGARQRKQQSESVASTRAADKASADTDGRGELRAEAEAAPPPAAAPAAAKPSPEPAPSRVDRLSSGAAPSPRQNAESSSAPQSLLSQARTVAQQQGCTAALATYERVVADDPSSVNAGLALIEMAQCRRSMGDAAGARALLQRAARIPAVTSRAKALLDSEP